MNRRAINPACRRRPHRVLLAAIAISTLAIAACGDDDDPAASDSTVAVTTGGEPAGTTAPPVPSSSTPPADTIEVVTSDFAFGGLPKSVPAGTRFEVTNTSETELHELVLVRLPDSETRSVDDIVNGDLVATLTGGPPALVILAPPGTDEQIIPVGDGTVSEPGRYLVICTIPTGVDPQEYLEAAAASNGAPPQVPGGPPHVAHGMYAEITVI